MSDWRADALCAQIPGDMFFPETTDTSATRAAKRICADCLVRAECLHEALQADTNPPGVWGGTSKPERRRIRRAIKETRT
jgi:WhiB family redox-sensing transcriptional regulator